MEREPSTKVRPLTFLLKKVILVLELRYKYSATVELTKYWSNATVPLPRSTRQVIISSTAVWRVATRPDTPRPLPHHAPLPTEDYVHVPGVNVLVCELF